MVAAVIPAWQRSNERAVADSTLQKNLDPKLK